MVLHSQGAKVCAAVQATPPLPLRGDQRGGFNLMLYVGRGAAHFLFLRQIFFLPPLALLLWRESREIPEQHAPVNTVTSDVPACATSVGKPALSRTGIGSKQRSFGRRCGEVPGHPPLRRPNPCIPRQPLHIPRMLHLVAVGATQIPQQTGTF